MKLQIILYMIVSSIGIGTAFGVALDNMAVGLAIGVAYGIAILPSMQKKQRGNCMTEGEK